MNGHIMGRTGSLIAWRVFAYIFMAFFTVLTVGPLFWLFYTSFKPHAQIVLNQFALPTSFFFENYQKPWEMGDLGVLILNSIFYAGIPTVLTVYLALAAGYAFVKFGFKVSKTLYAFFIMGLLITAHSVLAPRFAMETRMGINDTRLGVLLPYIGFGLLFAALVIATIPMIVFYIDFREQLARGSAAAALKE